MSGARLVIRQLSPRRDWVSAAACRGADTAVWFPEPEEPAEVAKAVCRRCQVQRECLAYALETRQHHGIWGGLSEQERRRLVSPRRRSPVR
ncbi:MAG: WhiB family transcriptional regulator [Actinobacteria bacterium]|nr:WhiB family transcriptional regulator [Actinomycetota bacterium]